MAADDVQLPDLEVIQRYSVAVRGASAPRAELIAALQADLDWLTSGAARPPGTQVVPAPTRTTTKTATKTASKPSKTRRAASAAQPAKAPAPPKRSARRVPAKRGSTSSTPPSEG